MKTVNSTSSHFSAEELLVLSKAREAAASSVKGDCGMLTAIDYQRHLAAICSLEGRGLMRVVGRMYYLSDIVYGGELWQTSQPC